MTELSPLPSDVLPAGIRGQSDWGVYQRPGAVERMQDAACTRLVGCHLLEGAGHWVQRSRQPGSANDSWAS